MLQMCNDQAMCMQNVWKSLCFKVENIDTTIWSLWHSYDLGHSHESKPDLLYLQPSMYLKDKLLSLWNDMCFLSVAHTVPNACFFTLPLTVWSKITKIPIYFTKDMCMLSVMCVCLSDVSSSLDTVKYIVTVRLASCNWAIDSYLVFKSFYFKIICLQFKPKTFI